MSVCVFMLNNLVCGGENAFIFTSEHPVDLGALAKQFTTEHPQYANRPADGREENARTEAFICWLEKHHGLSQAPDVEWSPI